MTAYTTVQSRVIRDVMVFPLYDGATMACAVGQLHEVVRQPAYDLVLAARGDVP
ncbi:MAG: hypothetical protein ACRDNW_27905 [Trebonia sp.]